MTVDALRAKLGSFVEDLHQSDVYGYKCDKDRLESLQSAYTAFIFLKENNCTEITEDLDCLIENKTN